MRMADRRRPFRRIPFQREPRRDEGGGFPRPGPEEPLEARSISSRYSERSWTTSTVEGPGPWSCWMSDLKPVPVDRISAPSLPPISPSDLRVFPRSESVHQQSSSESGPALSETSVSPQAPKDDQSGVILRSGNIDALGPAPILRASMEPGRPAEATDVGDCETLERGTLEGGERGVETLRALDTAFLSTDACSGAENRGQRIGEKEDRVCPGHRLPKGTSGRKLFYLWSLRDVGAPLAGALHFADRHSGT